jgi:hypothetical protein
MLVNLEIANLGFEVIEQEKHHEGEGTASFVVQSEYMQRYEESPLYQSAPFAETLSVAGLGR